VTGTADRDLLALLGGRVALISGGSRGQGAAEARLFARNGAAVVVSDILDGEGRAVVAGIARAGGEAEYEHLDVTSAADWERVVAATRERFGRLHILVNNAGVLHRGGVTATSVEEWDRVLAVNLTGPFLGMRAAAPLIRQSGGGAIVNVSSIAGLTGTPAAAYGASKWGLRGLTRAAALEFAPWGIRVNSIHPGVVATPMAEEFLAAAETAIPLGGRAARAEEIADLVVFLASERAGYISGAEIAIDGARSTGLGGVSQGAAKAPVTGRLGS
jgi:3alpha(or 20beta)-hydroxysteroid dehydrogenase